MAKVNLQETSEVEEGDKFECPECGDEHELKHNANDPEGTLVYRCGGDTLIAAIDNQPIDIS